MLLLWEGADDGDWQQITWGVHWGRGATGVLDGGEGAVLVGRYLYNVGSGTQLPAGRLYGPSSFSPLEVVFFAVHHPGPWGKLLTGGEVPLEGIFPGPFPRSRYHNFGTGNHRIYGQSL